MLIFNIKSYRKEITTIITITTTIIMIIIITIIIIIIIIIMKNFNRHNSHDRHGSKRRDLAQHAYSRGSQAFIHTLTLTQLQPRGAKRQLGYYIIWNKSTRGRGSKSEYPDSLPANRYHILVITGENLTAIA